MATTMRRGYTFGGYVNKSVDTQVFEEAPDKLNLSRLERRIRIKVLKGKGAKLVSEYKKFLSQTKPTPEELAEINQIKKQARAIDTERQALENSLRPAYSRFFRSCWEKFQQFRQKWSRLNFENRLNRTAFIAGLAVVVLLLVLIYYKGGNKTYSELAQVQHERDVAMVDLSQTKAKLAQAEAALVVQKQTTAKAGAVAESIDFQRLTVGSSGYEGSYISQLMANPRLADNDGRLKPYTGNPNDAKSLHNWAGKAAAQISILAGQCDQKFRKELWVKRPGEVAPVLRVGDNGKIVVDIHLKTGEGFSKDPTVTLKLADSFKTAKFIGEKEGGVVMDYEYVHSPK